MSCMERRNGSYLALAVSNSQASRVWFLLHFHVPLFTSGQKKKEKKLTLSYVYPMTLDSLVCFSENARFVLYS